MINLISYDKNTIVLLSKKLLIQMLSFLYKKKNCINCKIRYYFMQYASMKYLHAILSIMFGRSRNIFLTGAFTFY